MSTVMAVLDTLSPTAPYYFLSWSMGRSRASLAMVICLVRLGEGQLGLVLRNPQPNNVATPLLLSSPILAESRS